jgi:hypothetical protein
MYDMRTELLVLANRAKAMHRKDRLISLASVTLIGELERHNVAVNMNMTSQQFAAYVELTPNQYWKRAQAARVIHFFPRALAMVQAGETQVSHLALLAPKITEANSDLLLAGIKGKSKREVEELLSRVTLDGRCLDKEPVVELKIKLSKSQLQVLQRARQAFSASGHALSLPEVMVMALDDLLERRAPLWKAERAAVGEEKIAAPSPGKEPEESVPDRGQGSCSQTSHRAADDVTRPSPGKRRRESPTVAVRRVAGSKHQAGSRHLCFMVVSFSSSSSPPSSPSSSA